MSAVLSAVLSAEDAGEDILTLQELVQTCQCISETQRQALQDELRRLQRHGLRKKFSQRVYGLAPAAARVRLRRGCVSRAPHLPSPISSPLPPCRQQKNEC